MIYERLTLTAIYCIDLPVTVPNLYLVLALRLVSTIYEDKALIDAL